MARKATMKQFRELAAKALTDPEFAVRLRNDPMPVAAGFGITLTDAQAETIRGIDLGELVKLHDRLTSFKGVGRAAWADSTKWPWDWAKQLESEG